MYKWLQEALKIHLIYTSSPVHKFINGPLISEENFTIFFDYRLQCVLWNIFNPIILGQYLLNFIPELAFFS